MSNLDRFVPEPRLCEVDVIDVGVPLARAHAVVRHFDLARSPLVRALFSLRTLPARLRGDVPAPASLRFDDIGAPGTGFHIFVDDPASLVVTSIGRFWQSEIDFRDVRRADFEAFSEPGWGKLAWELRLEPRGEHETRIAVEVRVTATDDASWRRFRRYFRLIGPFSRFIRRHVLELLRDELGSPERELLARPLPGDERVPNAKAQVTDAIEIRATPNLIWPWLVQLGCGRGGWYSYDLLDNAGRPSARRIIPELQTLKVGDELPASPKSREGFMVERLEPKRLLLLHGLYDLESGQRVLPGEPRPAEFLEVGWAFVLEPLDAETTRLIVRVRANIEPDRKILRAFRVHVLHRLMQKKQLENVKRRAEHGAPSRSPRRRETALAPPRPST